ncbi:heavy metal-associated isoprenylated plant protein 30-like isoform X3 [Prosopis cineraria]|nr:heavy metal-associated isoprenylated plant protein 30-like isoform X3 [Prosopis cineraria]XP_054823971.1 heavy metal-associated isoprenylated plant protein 30-like isoform X3 [Prosopis cineraria]
MRTQDRERGCFSPLWVAFSILIGGLLLDVLISITFGVSALPVNIIIGVIIVLGLGTALRLALEFCHEWGLRRAVQRVETNVSHGYHPAVCWLACVHQPLTMVSPIAFVCSQPLWSLVFVLEEILPALLCTGSCKSQYALLPQLNFANLNSEASDGGTQTVVLKVRMCCTGCERVVKNAIYKLKGIDSVEVELEMERVTVVGYVDRNKVLKAVRRAGKRAEFWPYPNPPLYFTSSYNYFNDTASDFKESYNYYRHGYNMADKHGTIHVSQRGDDKVSNFFNDDNVNACSVM